MITTANAIVRCVHRSSPDASEARHSAVGGVGRLIDPVAMTPLPALAQTDPFGSDPLGLISFKDQTDSYSIGTDSWEVWVCDVPDGSVSDHAGPGRRRAQRLGHFVLSGAVRQPVYARCSRPPGTVTAARHRRNGPTIPSICKENAKGWWRSSRFDRDQRGGAGGGRCLLRRRLCNWWLRLSGDPGVSEHLSGQLEDRGGRWRGAGGFRQLAGAPHRRS